jgi:hypothetical protein
MPVRAWNGKSRPEPQGDYSLDLLPPGVYVVEATAAGFSPARAAGVQLAVNATRHIDLRLALPEVKENLRVEAVTPLVETETSEQGLVVGGQMIGDLPLNGRDFLRLARLAPGVSGATDNPASPAGPFNVNGQRDLSNNILIDGINANAGGSANGRISLAPGNDPAVGQSGSSVALVSVDAVSEFKVQTQMQTAEFGGFSGAVINVTPRAAATSSTAAATSFCATATWTPTISSTTPTAFQGRPRAITSSAAPSAGPSARTARSSSPRSKDCASASG